MKIKVTDIVYDTRDICDGHIWDQNELELPKITEVPLVDQIDENGAVTDSQLEASFITVTKKS